LAVEDRRRLVALAVDGEGRATMGLVGADFVIVAGEEVDARLELVNGGELVAPSQPLLERPVITLDAALGLGMVGLAVLEADAERDEIDLEGA
jgi:hypothetical protein